MKRPAGAQTLTAMGEQSEYFWLVTPSWRRSRHWVHAPQKRVQQQSSQDSQLSGQQLAGIWSRVRIALRTLQTMHQVVSDATKRKNSASCDSNGMAVLPPGVFTEFQ